MQKEADNDHIGFSLVAYLRPVYRPWVDALAASLAAFS